MAKEESKAIFGGLLGEYKYYDMDAVIAHALNMAELQGFHIQAGVVGKV